MGRDSVFPVFVQAGYITPTAPYSGKNMLERTYNMEPGGWYAVQKSDGGIVSQSEFVHYSAGSQS